MTTENKNVTKSATVKAKIAQIAEENTDETYDMEKTNGVLSDLYKNVTMAQNAIKTLLPYVEGSDVTRSLHKQVEDYDAFIEGVGTHAKKLGFDPTPAPKMAIAMSTFALRTKMIADKSTSHVAKIMILGTVNGIIDLYRLKKRASKDVENQTVKMVKEALDYEENVFEGLKTLL